MATKRLVISGYGQVELNNVAFRRDGRIEAQCAPNATDFANIPVENGMLLAVDDANHCVKLPKDGSLPIGLVYSTEHMYDERLAGGLKYYNTDKDSFLPRLGYLSVGDKFTTNTVVYDDALTITNAVYGYVKAGDNGYIRISATKPSDAIAEAPLLHVIDAKATMPNGAPAIKFQCIKA